MQYKLPALRRAMPNLPVGEEVADVGDRHACPVIYVHHNTIKNRAKLAG